MMIDTPGVGLSIGPCETSLTYPSSTVIQISSSGSGLHNFVFSALPGAHFQSELQVEFGTARSVSGNI